MRFERLWHPRPVRREIRIVLSWVALGVGTIMVIGSLIEILRISDAQQRSGFASSAGLLHGLVMGEVVVLVLLAVALLYVVGKRRLMILAGVVFVIGLVDVIFTAQAGVIP